MPSINTNSVTSPVGIVRIFQFILTLITFSLVASIGHTSFSFWAWSMFCWTFCCFITLLIIILELTCVNTKIPISWDDFTTAFAMQATLMHLAASVIYPVFFVCSTCYVGIAASVLSCICFVLYATEVGLTRAKPEGISNFLSTVPGLLKVLEVFVACIIFISLDSLIYNFYPGLKWCVAVYSICFIITLLIIILTIGRLLSRIPLPLDKVMIGYNVLAMLMYLTATIIWPIYCFDGNFWPSFYFDRLVVVSCMTAVNLIAYIVDTVYSVRLVFFVSHV
ncbi:hypothetical protein DNTS_020598 [Danionella cerebrum]|uniref:MARVEL domain-containing protein n=1 Tax=Danionella cerebrum TaxID=2873325 RepID=A0A553R577_9TELE|nr:hypothetical protein DNTS_020598 [Danionella translucida]